MPKLQIDGVGTIEVDDNFSSLPPEQQEATVNEIVSQFKGSRKAQPKAPAAPVQSGLAAPQPDYAPEVPQVPTGMDNGDFAPPLPSLGLTPEQEQATFDYIGQSAQDGTPTTPEGLQAFVRQFGAIEFEDPQKVLEYYGEGIRPTVVHTPRAAEQEQVDVTAQEGYPKERIPDWMSTLVGAGEGVTYNYLDEIGAGLQTVLPIGKKSIWDGSSFGEAYDANVDQNRAVLDAIQAEDPLLRLAGNVGGSFLAPVPVKGRNMLTNVTQNRGMKSAAIDGGIYGFISGTGRGEEDAMDRLTKGATDATAGIALGATIGKIAERGTKGRRDNLWVNDQADNNPYAAFDAEIVDDLKRVSSEAAKAKGDPKGRAKLTIKEVNNLEQTYQGRYKDMINGLDIPPSEKLKLKEALDSDYSSAVQAAEALRGTPQGDAVADAIIKTQRLRALTPEASASGLGPKLKAMLELGGTVGGGVAGGPVGSGLGFGAARYALSRLGNTEKARVNSADRLIKKAERYSKLGQKVGPSGQRESQDALRELYTETADGAYNKSKTLAAEREAKKADKASTEAVENEFNTKVRNPSLDENDLKFGNLAKRADTAKKAAEKVTAKSSSGLSSFDDLFMVPKTSAAKPKAPVREQTAIEKNIEAGIQGTSRTQKAFAERLGVPEKDMLRALETIKGDVPEFSNEIDRIAFNYPTTKQRGIADVLVPRMKQVLEADGTMARIQQQAEEAAARAAAKRKLAKPEGATIRGGNGKTPATPLSPEVYERLKDVTDGKKGMFIGGGSPEDEVSSFLYFADDAPEGSQGIDVVEVTAPDGKSSKYVTPDEARKLQEGNMVGVSRPEQWQAGKEQFQAQADSHIERLFSDETVSDKAYKLIGDAPDIVKNNYRTTQEAKEYIDEVVLPDLEIAKVDPSEIATIRSYLLDVASAKRYATRDEYKAGTSK